MVVESQPRRSALALVVAFLTALIVLVRAAESFAINVTVTWDAGSVTLVITGAPPGTSLVGVVNPPGNCNLNRGAIVGAADENGDATIVIPNNGGSGNFAVGDTGYLLYGTPQQEFCFTLDNGNVGTAGACACNPPPGPNHYLCRQVKDLKSPAKFVSQAGVAVSDQTGSDTCDLKKPFLLCDPASKNGGPVSDESAHLCCYKAKCTAKPAISYQITDQFGTITVSTKKPKFLCNPCVKAPA